MKCPKCQNEINTNARFCVKCGCNIAEALANANQQAKPVSQAVCAKCGAELMPGAKFCTKCGTPITPAVPQEDDEKTVLLFTEDTNSANSQSVHNNHVGNGVNAAGNQYGNIVDTPNIIPPENNKKAKKKNKKAAGQPKEQEKAGAGLVIAAVILGILVIASGVVCFLVWNGTISLPAGDKTITVEVTAEETESASEEATSAADSDVNPDELFAEEDELLAEAKSRITVDAEIVNGMNNLEAVIDQSVAKAEEAGDTSLAADRVTEAYLSYVTAVGKHKDMLDGSTLSGGIYGQVMMEMEDAIALGDELASKGYNVDTSSLVSAKDEFDKTYTDKIINTFDEFTSREAWSRTESWNLMSETADNMFDPSDLDNPIRLRYAYALSWWTQKQIETELANGTITAKGAAIKIANLIDVMDYNPMMINYYINYMHEAGEDCAGVEEAYQDIVEQIAGTQGLTIGEDVALDHFWYFNDFVTHPVDSINGVTQENREWIRDRMSSVTFLKQ